MNLKNIHCSLENKRDNEKKSSENGFSHIVGKNDHAGSLGRTDEIGHNQRDTI